MLLTKRLLWRSFQPCGISKKVWATKLCLVGAVLACGAVAQDAKQSGFDVSQLDRSADPCVDFYQFSCGGWRAKNPLPADKARYNRYEEMSEENKKRLREILEAAAQAGASQDSISRQVGDFYAACVDESMADKKGKTPLDPYLTKISALSDKKAFLELMASLDDEGVSTLFNFSSAPDRHNASMVIAEVDQGGLSLPDRDFYLTSDAKSVERRQKFVEHVARMFALIGESPSEARNDADVILAIETELAKASLDRTARRDPKNLDHKMTLAEFNQLAPNLYFADYLQAAEAPKFDSLNVTTPQFFSQVSAIIDRIPLDQWKTYIRWKVVRSLAPMLSSDMVNEYFGFNSIYLRGTTSIEPRWKRCVSAVDYQLGEASGKLFVDKYFGAQGRETIRRIVQDVMNQLEEGIRTADWMSPETKQKALVKLKKIDTSKLGFPDKFRDYSSIVVKRDDYVGNYVRTSQFESRREKAKIDKPLDRTEWEMTPPTVNAYYDPSFNEIVLPAGILQPPMFDQSRDEAYTYGAIGRVIGHELTHGFDDEGRKYDADGNLTDWWTAGDAKSFDERAACIATQYSGFSPVDDGNGKPLYLNGKLTLGENVADNGGLRFAYAAYFKSQEGKELKVVDGFTPEQRVFLGYAISRCENVTPQTSRLLIVTDPHSPGKFRLLGPIENMQEFQSAFSCKAGQPMVPEKRCRVW
jgi:endothelin-converting enzyme/putative endopeptidase